MAVSASSIVPPGRAPADGLAVDGRCWALLNRRRATTGQRGTMPTKLSAALIASAVLAWSPGTSANSGGRCDNGTIKGRYAVQASGYLERDGKFVPITAVRTTEFDGNGRSGGSGWASIGGEVSRFSSAGTYRVFPDCTLQINADITVGDPTNIQFGVIADGGNRIYSMRIDAGQNATVNFERIWPK
jgi:hypothetical protein